MTLDNALTWVSLIKGDARSVSIGSYCKHSWQGFFCDEYRTQLSKDYPEYGFKNAGYGTKQHLLAIGMMIMAVRKEHRKPLNL